MNKAQRKEWEDIIDSITKSMNETPIININTLVAANTHILKLEREIHQLKSGKRIAKLLLPKENV